MSYIKLDRKIIEWEWFTDGNVLKVWIYLLETAQYKDINYKGIDVKRGQVITGRKKLAERLDMSEQQIRTCLDKLQSTNEITITPTNKYSLITIVKYAEYQDCIEDNNQQINQQPNQQITNNQPTNNQQITTIQESKKVRKKEYIYKGISEKVIEALKDFKNMRNLKKKPLTDKAMERLIKKLEKLSGGNEEVMIQILNQSTDNGWQDIYELKRSDSLPVYDTSKNREMSKEEEEQLLKLMGRA